LNGAFGSFAIVDILGQNFKDSKDISPKGKFTI